MQSFVPPLSSQPAHFLTTSLAGQCAGLGLRMTQELADHLGTGQGALLTYM